MKKLLLALAFASASAGANATVSVGSVAPDFTLTDINGQSHHLYSYLDSGYTVIIDVSAAWCGPCWAAHNSHVFDNLMTHYGPNGTITPKKIMVLFIEGESTNTTNQLHGTSSGSSYATFSQGDWVTGTNYPIIDNSSQNSNYLVDNAFPAFTIIGRDRLVYYANAGYGSNMASESYWLNFVNQAPNYAPSTTTDAKAVTYTGTDAFICNAAPVVKFQNYSKTNSITSATINIKSGSTTVKSQSWTGNLAPYAVATVNVGSFTPTAAGPFKFEVVVSGDSKLTNNASADSVFTIFSPASAATGNWSQNFEASSTKLPYPMSVTDPESAFPFRANGSLNVIGSNGSITTAVVFLYASMNNNSSVELMLGNFNTASASNVALDFDWAYAQRTASNNDKLEIKVSNDCGTTWTTAWSKTGAAMSTHAPQSSTEFIPSSAADWKHMTALLTASKGNNMLVKFVATSNQGNYGWLDNLKITNSTGVENVLNTQSVNLYPNPASEASTLEFTLARNSKVTINVTDAMGRTVDVLADGMMSQGTQHISIPTNNLAAGVYNVSIQTEQGNLTQRLSVVK